MRPAERFVPVILAAGGSTRMGRPKALLDFDGRSCLDLVLAACDGAGLGKPIVVVAPDSPVAAEVARRSLPVTLAQNPHPEHGQTSSLQAGLACVPADAVAFLIYPVDTPLMRDVDVARLVAAFPTASPAPVVVAPSFRHRRGHPVVVDARLRPAMAALPSDGSARTVLAQHAAATRHVDFSDDRASVDMDTPADYAACLDRFRRGG